MTTYIVRRLIQSVFILIGLTFVFFFMLHLIPNGGPCEGILAGTSPAKATLYKACLKRLGLTKPLPTQYLLWILGLLRGDFGTDNGGVPVTQLILNALPITVMLASVSYVLQQLIALPLGIFSALKQYSFFDTVFTFVSYVGLSTPTFFLGLMLLYLLTVDYRIFPAGQVVNPRGPFFLSSGWWSNVVHDPAGTLGDYTKHLVLPALTLMYVGIAGDSRFMRASMLDVIHQDYIRTAKAKGLSRRVVIFKHAFRNAVLPIITNVALYLPTLVGGFIITEAIFSYFGLGYLFISRLQGGDYNVVLALLMIQAAAVLIANLLSDLTYAWVDPRIRYD